MGKQQTKKSKRAAELRQGARNASRGAGTRFIVKGKTFTMGGWATSSDIAEHLRANGYMRGAEVLWKGSAYTLERDSMGDPTLVRAA